MWRKEELLSTQPLLKTWPFMGYLGRFIFWNTARYAAYHPLLSTASTLWDLCSWVFMVSTENQAWEKRQRALRYGLLLCTDWNLEPGWVWWVKRTHTHYFVHENIVDVENSRTGPKEACCVFTHFTKEAQADEFLSSGRRHNHFYQPKLTQYSHFPPELMALTVNKTH